MNPSENTKPKQQKSKTKSKSKTATAKLIDQKIKLMRLARSLYMECAKDIQYNNMLDDIYNIYKKFEVDYISLTRSE